MDNRNNSTTGKQGGFNMTVTLDKKYTLETAVKEFIDKFGKPPEAIRTLCFMWGKYVQLFENAPMTAGEQHLAIKEMRENMGPVDNG